MALNSYVYLDNNATTIIPDNVLKTMMSWANMGNPSGSYASAKMCKKMIELFKEEIAKVCNFSLNDYDIIFNSCASESNNHIIKSVVDAYSKKTGSIPHVIISGVEHKSLDECVDLLEKCGSIELTKLPAVFRSITIKDLEKVCKQNTALISVMAANNETGIINDIEELQNFAKSRGIIFHSDCVQYFGKIPFSTVPDAFSASFHKIHGPAGCGLLVMRKDIFKIYDLCPLVCGTQNDGKRGGTENIMGIAGSFAAFRYTMSGLATKSKKVMELRNNIVKQLSKKFECYYIGDFNKKLTDKPILVFIEPRNFHGVLPNTISVSVARIDVCNKAIRNGLEYKGILVGLGSACNGSAQSNIMARLGVPEELRAGIIRISLSSMNTQKEIDKFVEIFSQLIVSEKILKI